MLHAHADTDHTALLTRPYSYVAHDSYINSV